MSTTELDKAAEEASEALGMSVELGRTEHTGGLCYPAVVIWPPMDGADGDQPTENRAFETDAAPLAYLEGLEAGARIQRERHADMQDALLSTISDLAVLRDAAQAFLTRIENITTAEFQVGGEKAERYALAAALKDLED